VHSSHFCCHRIVAVKGGAGKQGSVQSVKHATDNSSYRSFVDIKWDDGGINQYRRGYRGFVDVKYDTPGGGENYYKEHLPKLGNITSERYLS